MGGTMTEPDETSEEALKRFLTEARSEEPDDPRLRAHAIDVGRFWASSHHVLANGWAPEVDHSRFGRVRRWGPLTTVDGLNPEYRTAPLAGEHTDVILSALGHTPDEIARLRDERDQAWSDMEDAKTWRNWSIGAVVAIAAWSAFDAWRGHETFHAAIQSSDESPDGATTAQIGLSWGFGGGAR